MYSVTINIPDNIVEKLIDIEQIASNCKDNFGLGLVKFMACTELEKALKENPNLVVDGKIFLEDNLDDREKALIEDFMIRLGALLLVDSCRKHRAKKMEETIAPPRKRLMGCLTLLLDQF